jgi:zinc/manganese transport system permease protein
MDITLNWSEKVALLLWPLIATLTLPWLLVYLGLHIVRRGVIFVDLALAQVAAFGTCAALMAGYDAHDWQSFAFSMGFTLFGAGVLTFTRARDQKVPQEALIGIVYVVAAAASILALSKSAAGKEELQRSLVGELLVVPPAEVLKTAVLYLVVGAVFFALRKSFHAISHDPDQAQASGMNLRWWDFVFYLLFGVVVTSFVHIGGVLLAFSCLVIPAVCANYLAKSFGSRFLVGWIVVTIAGVSTLLVTSEVDLPIGAAMVCALGLELLLVLGIAAVRRR